jgi:hypothetical protein
VGERDVAFGKLAIARGLVAREVVSDCFRAIHGSDRPLRDELVRRGLIPLAVAADLERALGSIPPGPPLRASSARQAALPTGPPRNPNDPLPRPGDVIDGYRVEKLLGKGGMGAVFLARHETSGAEAALKCMLVEGEDAGPFLERFKREMEAVAKVDRQAGIARIRSFGFFGAKRLPYAAMDFIRGGDLSERLQKGPLEPRLAASFVTKIARAVHHCHEQGVIHRDLKPANILVRADDEEPFVTDFGLARDDTKERLTLTGEVLGTPAYMAPEQAEGQPERQDRRTDVYALGAILYECLVGEPPFAGSSNVILLKKVLLEDPRSPASRRPGVPDELSVIALRCLAKEKIHRYPTAAELASELGRYLRGEPILTKPVPLATRVYRRLRRGRGIIAMALLAVLFALGGMATAYRELKWLPAQKKLTEALDPAEAALTSAGYPLAVLDAGANLRALEAVANLSSAARGLDEVYGGVFQRAADRARVARLERWAELIHDPSRALSAPARPKGADHDAAGDVLEAAALIRLIVEAPAGTAGEDQTARSRKLLDGLTIQPEPEVKAPLAIEILKVILQETTDGWDELRALGAAIAPDGTLVTRWAPAFLVAWENVARRAFVEGKPASAGRIAKLTPQLTLLAGLPGFKKRFSHVLAESDESLYTNILGPLDVESLDPMKTVVSFANTFDAVEASDAARPVVDAQRARLAERLSHGVERLAKRGLGNDADSQKSNDGALTLLVQIKGLGKRPEPASILGFLRGNEPVLTGQLRTLTADDVVRKYAIMLSMGLAPREIEQPTAALRSRADRRDPFNLAILGNAATKLLGELPNDRAVQLTAAIATFMAIRGTRIEQEREARAAGDERSGKTHRVLEAELGKEMREALVEARRLIAPFLEARAKGETPEETLLRAVAAHEAATLYLDSLLVVDEDAVRRNTYTDLATLGQSIDLELRALELGHPRAADVEEALCGFYDLRIQALGLVAPRPDRAGELAGADADQLLEHARTWEQLYEKADAEVKKIEKELSPSEEQQLRTYELCNFYHLANVKDFALGDWVKPIRLQAMAEEWHARILDQENHGEAAHLARERELDLLQRVASIFPEQQDAQLKLAILLKGEAERHHAPGRLVEALEHAEKAIARDATGADSFNPQERKDAEAFCEELRALVKSQK